MSGTHAVVTGGGSGIGLAIARALADAGHKVTIMGRDQKRLNAAGVGTPVVCDVGDGASVGAAFATAVAANGPVAILVNNAGIVRTAPFHRATDTDWTDMWRTNVMGAVNAIRQVSEPMKAVGGGRIINIASTAALKGYAYVSAYTASKHALLGMTRSLALEFATAKITVNAICPGYADTEIIRNSVDTLVTKTGRSREDALKTFTGASPMGRLIAPEEVAAAVLWLISDAASAVTGQAIAIAGGEVM